MADGVGAAAGAGRQTTHCKHGIWQGQMPVVGMTVAEARKMLKTTWQMPDDAVGYKGKERLADDYVIQQFDEINFQRKQGEKG